MGTRTRQQCAHVEVFGNRQRREHLAALRDLPDAEIADAVRRQPGNVGPAQHDAAPGGMMHACNRADQRGLARAVRAHDRDDRTLLHLQRHAVQRLGVAVKDVDLLDRKHHTASVPR
jgi:hypothetical protein